MYLSLIPSTWTPHISRLSNFSHHKKEPLVKGQLFLSMITSLPRYPQDFAYHFTKFPPTNIHPEPPKPYQNREHTSHTEFPIWHLSPPGWTVHAMSGFCTYNGKRLPKTFVRGTLPRLFINTAKAVNKMNQRIFLGTLYRSHCQTSNNSLPFFLMKKYASSRLTLYKL